MEVQLDAETIAQLNKMMSAFETETGLGGMQVFSGYRDKADQDSRYEDGSTGFRGGYSDYHSGRSFNLKINFGDGTSDYYNAEKYPKYSWIAEHAAEYGFVVRYPDGKDEKNRRGQPYIYIPLCRRTPCSLYAGTQPLSGRIQSTVYTATVRTTRWRSRLMARPIRCSMWGIGGTKDVQVTIPSGTYTASGDNISGYIVTCE